MTATQMDPRVLADIKKFPEFVDNMTCLECGYVGPMGIMKVDVPWYASGCMFWFCAIGMGIMLPVVGFFIWFILAAIGAGSCRVRHFHCPMCDKELIERSA